MLLAWMKGTSMYGHVAEAWDAAQQHLAMEYMDSLWRQVVDAVDSSYANHSSKNGSAAAVSMQKILAMPDAQAVVKRLVREHRIQATLFHAYYGNYADQPLNRYDSPATHASSQPEAAKDQQSVVEQSASRAAAAAGAGAGRRLLQQQPDQSSSTGGGDDDNPVDLYSSLVASKQGFSNLAIASFSSAKKDGSRLITETWLQGPFGWPPRFVPCEFV